MMRIIKEIFQAIRESLNYAPVLCDPPAARPTTAELEARFAAPAVSEMFDERCLYLGDDASAVRKWKITGKPDLSSIPRAGDAHPALNGYIVACEPARFGDTIIAVYHPKPRVITRDLSHRRWAAWPVKV